MEQNYLAIGVVVLIVGLSIYATVSHFKRKGMQWSGVVLDKGSREIKSVDRSPREKQSSLSVGGFTFGGGTAPAQQTVTYSYFIVVKTDAQEEIKWDISEGLYEVIKVGDRVKKDSGAMTPQIIN